MIMSKLLFFASDFKIGLSTLLTDELIALYRYGIEVCAVAGENEQESGLSEKIKIEAIPIFRIDGLDRHEKFKELAISLIDIMVKNKIRVVHVQNNWQLALMAYVKFKLCFKQKIRIIYTLHGFRHNHLLKSYVAQVIIGLGLLCFADKVICMSGYLRKKFKLLSYKIELLPLGVSTSFFSGNYCPLPQNGLQMIFPAQFRHGKNQDIIIRAFAEHIRRTNDNDSKLVLPGAGDLLSEMKGLTERLGISNRVEFPGLLCKEDVRLLYLKSNIGIVSSNSETFGQSIVEPFVLGRCVISTPVGIANDIIQNGVNGYIYTSQKDLVEKFDYLYTHQNMIYQMDTEDILRLVAKYYSVHQILWDGPINTSDLKKRLMEEYHLPESTARSYINAIADEKAGLLHMDEDIVYTEEAEIEELEDRLETLFDWNEFDSRRKKHDECLANLKLAELEIENLKDDLTKADINLKRAKKKYENEISDLEVCLGRLRSEHEDTKIELLNTEENLIRVKAELNMVLEDWNIWRFMGHRIDFYFCNWLKKLAKEDK